MSTIDQLFERPQYSIAQEEKEAILGEELTALSQWHQQHCSPYASIMDALHGNWTNPSTPNLKDLPSLPVRLFKLEMLHSLAADEIFKTLTSSGTTSQQVSKIVLDRETAVLQTKALATIVKSFIGPKRLPMILIDSQSTVKNRVSFSARGAGLLGMSNFGRNHFYALDEQMRPDHSGLDAFLEKHEGQPILIFGFTFMVWQYFYKVFKESGRHLSLDQATLIHSGGWKKLQEEAVSNAVFKDAFQQQFGLSRIHNFYGMVEQVGSIYMECEQGFLHAPNFSDVIVRDYKNGAPLPHKTQGLIQTLSVLPRSYPGHSLLSEDLGTIHGVDDCACGRKGTYFTIEGRIPKAELRGCSDTHAQSVSDQKKSL